MNEEKRKLCDFACSVCMLKTKTEHPKVIGCPWRDISNEYCDELLEVLSEVSENA